MTAIRDYLALAEAAAPPTRSFARLWHVGSLKAGDKRRGSYEGAGLSVSLHPTAWRGIARGLVGGDLWRCERPGNRFLDFHRLGKRARATIGQWAVANGMATRASVWRFTYYDDEADEERYFEFATEAEAMVEYEDNPDGTVSERPGALHATERLRQRTLNAETVVDLGLLSTVWVEDATSFDGVWWADTLDPLNLSAPRGVIAPTRIAQWRFTRMDDRAAPDYEDDDA